jgi:hypothetical protein
MESHAMTHEEILEKAIRKAIDNGWQYLDFDYNGEPGFTKKSHEFFDEERLMFTTDWQTDIPVYNVIFSHDFARALWGTKKLKWSFNEYDFGYEAWQLHLQEMVISDDPLDYLGANI